MSESTSAIMEADNTSLKKFTQCVFEEDSDEDDEDFGSAEPFHSLFSKSLNIERVRSWMWDSTLPKPLNLFPLKKTLPPKITTHAWGTGTGFSQSDSALSNGNRSCSKRHRKDIAAKRRKSTTDDRQYFSDSEPRLRETNWTAEYSPTVSQAYVPLVRCPMPDNCISSSLVNAFPTPPKSRTVSEECEMGHKLYLVRRDFLHKSRPKGISRVRQQSEISYKRRLDFFQLPVLTSARSNSDHCATVFQKNQEFHMKVNISNNKNAKHNLSPPISPLSESSSVLTFCKKADVDEFDEESFFTEELSLNDHMKFFPGNKNERFVNGGKMRQIRRCRLKKNENTEKNSSSQNPTDQKNSPVTSQHDHAGARRRTRVTSSLRIKAMLKRCSNISNNRHSGNGGVKKRFRQHSRTLLVNKSLNHQKTKLQALRRTIFAEVKKTNRRQWGDGAESSVSKQGRRPLLQSRCSTKGSFISRLLECGADALLTKE